MREEQKKVIQKEMDRLEHLGIIQKGLTSYSSPVVLVKWKIKICIKFCHTSKHCYHNKTPTVPHTLTQH